VFLLAAKQCREHQALFRSRVKADSPVRTKGC
jgi:ribosomal protein L3 glutamine methyltransferase